MAHSTASATDIRDQLQDAIDHFEQLLPGQAPIGDFVHHNTLHGYQHLPFQEALAASRKLTGARGYLSEQQFRDYFAAGRITRQDLLKVLARDPHLASEETVAELAGQLLKKSDVYLSVLLNPIKPVTVCQLNWQIEELQALSSFQPDVPGGSRRKLLAAAAACGIEGEQEAIADLWRACLEALGLTHYLLHPEELVDLSPEHAESMLAELGTGEGREGGGQPVMDRLLRKEASRLLSDLLQRVGRELTLRGLLQAVTGHDILDELRPNLLRQLANYLDLGLAAWHSGVRDQGFYRVWRHSAANDLAWVFEQLPDWYSHLESLPDDPLDTVIMELRRLGLHPSKWADYLRQLALELPGWSGMFLWRQQHPDYQGCPPGGIQMVDYLAVRLVLEHLFAQRLCAELWQLEASIDMLRWYFRRQGAEFYVRHTLYNTRLPEYLSTLAQQLTEHTALERPGDQAWWQLAHMIRTWRQSPAADRPLGHSIYRSGWRLFRLAQHLGLCGGQVRALAPHQLKSLFDCLQRLSEQRVGFLWLQAYELHYRDQFFNGLANNWQRRALGATGAEKAGAQLVFCMDDREEGMRRHLEEIDPGCETFGAAAHFSVPNYWHGLDESKPIPLCPVVVTPIHKVREKPRPGQESAGARRAVRRSRRLATRNLLHQESRRNLLGSTALITLAAPVTLAVLVGKVLAPRILGRYLRRGLRRYEPPVETELALTAEQPDPGATGEHPQLGFTDDEQADRVEMLLRNIGLVDDFAPLVVIMAHGSASENNPHRAAYDCGACSGRHSGPNARIAAAMANRPQVRRQLSARGISIPAESWFIGAEHNTCNESVEWYDSEAVPVALRPALDRLRRSLDEAGRRHAHERCRRLASAPRSPTPEQALKHVQERLLDFSQARPELGHATNAAAVIGRRGLTRGVFFDRRVFLISYDPETDPKGEVLERLLLANAPVGAGINLEYYFSTVDNQRYGSGSKVTHNLTGLFGVMDGSASDLRTGLPKQMIEVHEAMRLQVLVEARLDTLTAIYGRQPTLQELVGNGWLLLSAIDPRSGDISVFDPSTGFVPWDGVISALPQTDNSAACYSGSSEPIAPKLISRRGRTRDA